jgi:hypothetical protein
VRRPGAIIADHRVAAPAGAGAAASRGTIMDAPLWALVANASRARVFTVDRSAGRLTEIADFVHPAARMAGAALGDERGGHSERGTADGGAGGAAFEPRTDRRHKELAGFARELAGFLGDAVAQHRCGGVLLIASDALLGQLRAHLNSATTEAVRVAEPLDIGWLDEPALSRRVLELARPRR